MCGIVGAVSERNVTPILMEGLRRLEYRGYDSAGIAIFDDNKIQRLRRAGKVQELQNALDKNPITGFLGISHTRWATHGVPTENNAHPHLSEQDIALVHNGIIENHEVLKNELLGEGYTFESDTDTEVVVHRIHYHLAANNNLFDAVNMTVRELEGAYALAVISKDEPHKMMVARSGCPVVIGIGINENYVASDVAALLPVTNNFMFLEEDDVAILEKDKVTVFDSEGIEVTRKITESKLSSEATERGEFKHFMLKEIHEQSIAVGNTLNQRIADGQVLENAFGPDASLALDQVKGVHIVACGTSYHAGLVARYWIEDICRVPCSVEIASEYRYRNPVVPDNTLFVTISQSGETADTLAALREAKKANYVSTLVICNVPESSMVRESLYHSISSIVFIDDCHR